MRILVLGLLLARIIFPSGKVIYAELALTPQQHAKGLMGREELPEDRGMLFVFTYPEVQTFWMKNMKFSIDIIWLDQNGTVLGIENEVPPCRQEPCPVYISPAPVKYVLEVKAGLCKKEGLRVGDILTIEFPERKD